MKQKFLELVNELTEKQIEDIIYAIQQTMFEYGFLNNDTENTDFALFCWNYKKTIDN